MIRLLRNIDLLFIYQFISEFNKRIQYHINLLQINCTLNINFFYIVQNIVFVSMFLTHFFILYHQKQKYVGVYKFYSEIYSKESTKILRSSNLKQIIHYSLFIYSFSFLFFLLQWRNFIFSVGPSIILLFFYDIRQP